MIEVEKKYNLHDNNRAMAPCRSMAVQYQWTSNNQWASNYEWTSNYQWPLSYQRNVCRISYKNNITQNCPYHPDA